MLFQQYWQALWLVQSSLGVPLSGIIRWVGCTRLHPTLINTVVMGPTMATPQRDLIKRPTTVVGANIGMVAAGIIAGEIGEALTLKIMREIAIDAGYINIFY